MARDCFNNDEAVQGFRRLTLKCADFTADVKCHAAREKPEGTGSIRGLLWVLMTLDGFGYVPADGDVRPR